tara:strand:- start:3518 stop:3688 length:171 start_codon:yes stop_codon:yes gene_type:complete
MGQEAGYNFLNTAYTGTSAASLSGLGSEAYNIHKIISLNDTGVAMTTAEGEQRQII